MPEGESLTAVYKTQNSALFQLAKSLLDDAGIEYFARGENLSLAYGGEFVIEVVQSNVGEAKDVLKDFLEGEYGDFESPEEKVLGQQRGEFNYALTIGIICFVIILILLAVFFVKC